MSTSRGWVNFAIIVGAVAVVVAALVFLGLWRVTEPVVPDLTTMPQAAAATAIQNAGLTLGASSQLATTAVGPGRVVTQTPSPGVRVRRRSSVDVTLAVTPVQSVVPGVLGEPQERAVQTLTGALFLPAVLPVYGVNAGVGSVAEQAPSAGTPWMTGSPVGIAVAAGAPTPTCVKVPDLRGDDPKTAAAKIDAAGLAVSAFISGLSDPAANVVVEQLPQADVLVQRGTRILIITAIP